MQSGGSITIQEALQFKQYQFTFAVNDTAKFPYHKSDDMTLNKRLLIIGNMIFARVHFKDVLENDEIIGVHYHYEFIAGQIREKLLCQS